MESLSFSQDELKILMAIINHAFKMGNLSVGDAIAVTPIAIKLQEKVKQPEPNHQETVAAEPVKN